jgi:hypothetical protein
MFSSSPHKGKQKRLRASALALLGATAIAFSLLHYRVHGFEEPSEYEARPHVQTSSWLSHAPRLEKIWLRSATEWLPSRYVYSRVIHAVYRIPLVVHLFGSWLIRAPPVLPSL